MLQIYFLSVIYLSLASMLLLLDSYREQLAFLLRFRAVLREDKRAQYIFFISGILVSVLALLLPVSPGPVILGDFIPAVTIALESFYFLVSYGEKNRDRGLSFSGIKLEERRRNAGYASAAIALIHFIFPSFVLL